MGFLISIGTLFMSFIFLFVAAVKAVDLHAGTTIDPQPYVIAVVSAAAFWQLSNALENK